MTPLAEILIRQIRSEGPMTVAAYMQACLLHPQHGYYTSRTAIGAAGDFITAPEISQMFGELIGLSLAQAWLDQGAPAPFALVELGPGRGTLMADLLRATRGVPGFHDAMRLYMVEASPILRAAQAYAIAPTQATWVNGADDLPQLPTFFVANEFFDALPVRQFLRDGEAWRERVVGLRDDNLAFGLSPVLTLPELAPHAGWQTGEMATLCPQAAPVIDALTSRIARHGGAGLVIDYGDHELRGDTFQAVSGHSPTDPLAAPGQADLTSHVAFDDLIRAAQCRHSALTPQGVFLERLGIAQRARKLAEVLSGKPLDTHVAAFRRLTHPDEMGTLFKVVGFYPESCSPPPGLEHDA